MQLVGPNGAPGSLGALAIVPDSLGTVIAPVNGVLPRGGYIVRWQAAGDDGHVIRGEFAFTVLAKPDRGEAAGGVPAPHDPSSPGMPHTATAPDQNGFDSGSPLFVALRWVMYLGLLGIIGSVVFQGIVLALVRRRGGEAGQRLAEAARAPAGRVGRAAAVVLLLSVPGRLVAQSVAMHGPAASFDASLVTGMLAHTMWGWSWLAQLGAKDSYEPKVMPIDQAMVGSLLRNSGQAYAAEFYRNVVAHHRRAVTVIDEYLPKAKRADLKVMAEQMKRDQLAEIAEFERKAGAH